MSPRIAMSLLMALASNRPGVGRDTFTHGFKSGRGRRGGKSNNAGNYNKMVRRRKKKGYAF